MLAGKATSSFSHNRLGLLLAVICVLFTALPSPRFAQAQEAPVESQPVAPQAQPVHTQAQSVPADGQPAPAQTRPLPEEFRFATGLYKQQRWDLAAAEFRKFLDKYPQHERTAYAKLYLGLTLVNADRFTEARSVLREYVRDYPRSKSLPDALYRVGECSYLMDDLPAAQKEFSRFVTQYPRHELAEWALPYLADAELRLKQPQAARDHFKQALERFPKSRLTDDSQFGLAKSFDALKETDQAAAIYAQLALNLTSPRAVQSLMNLATLKYRTGKFDQAAKSFLRVVEQFPKSGLVGSAHLNAGFSFYQLGQYPAAIVHFDAAAANKQQAPLAGYWKGISLKAMSEYVKASRALKTAYEADPKGALAEGCLFYWADCELRSGHYQPAKRLFLDVVAKWPKGEFADDSLHYAAEATLAAGDVSEAEQLVARFQKEYAESHLQRHEEILLGRVLNAKASLLAKEEGEKNQQLAVEARRAAIGHLERVMTKSQLPATVTRSRYYLGRVLQDSGEHARAVADLAPLVEQAGHPNAPREAVESLAVSGHSLHLLGRHAEAVATLSTYLAQRGAGSEQREQALEDRALSNAQLGRREAATTDATLLLQQFPKSSAGKETIRRLAEVAYDAKEWNVAAELFGKLAELGPQGSELRRTGLSGLGWTRFQMKAYDQSSAAFAQVFEQYPPHNPQVAEAGYMRARMLQEAGKFSEAAKAYEIAFQKLAPSTPAVSGEESQGPAQYAFLSGVQAGNLLARLKRYDEADAAYHRLVDRFPKAKGLAPVLFDWASMLFVAKKDPEHLRRARQLLSRIPHEFPDSPVNENARLFLAELDLEGGQTVSAEKTIRELLSEPKAGAKVREDALVRLIELAAQKQEWPAVRESAEKFLSEFPHSPDSGVVRLHLASAHLGLKNAAAAEKTLVALKEQIVAQKQENVDWAASVWILLAEAFHKQKNYAEVEATVEDLRQRIPKSPLFYQAEEILGRTYKNQAQWDKAIAAFQRVIDDRHGEQNETAAKSQLMIADCRFLQQNYLQAREEYLKVFTLYDKLPEWGTPALFQVGQCEELLKQFGDAKKTYSQLIASFPESHFASDAKKRLDELNKRPSG